MQAEQFAPLPARLDVRELQYRVHRKGFRVQTLPWSRPSSMPQATPATRWHSSTGPGGVWKPISRI
jgi:hypothetical protein